MIRIRSADEAWRMLNPAPRAAKPKAIRPSGRRRSGAVLRTLPSDSSCRSRTPTRDCSHRLGEWGGGRNARKSSENDPVSAPRRDWRSGSDHSRAACTTRPENRLRHRRTPYRRRSVAPRHPTARRSGRPIPAETRAAEEPQARASKATHRQWQRTPPAQSGCRDARAGTIFSVRS